MLYWRMTRSEVGEAELKRIFRGISPSGWDCLATYLLTPPEEPAAPEPSTPTSPSTRLRWWWRLLLLLLQAFGLVAVLLGLGRDVVLVGVIDCP